MPIILRTRSSPCSSHDSMPGIQLPNPPKSPMAAHTLSGAALMSISACACPMDRHHASAEAGRELRDEVHELAGAGDEDVEVAAGGILHVLPRLKLHVSKSHRRHPLGQR